MLPSSVDVGPIEERLPLTPETRRRLEELSAWHDGDLNWDYPPDPSPWSLAECDCFEKAADQILSVLRAEPLLGPEDSSQELWGHAACRRRVVQPGVPLLIPEECEDEG